MASKLSLREKLNHLRSLSASSANTRKRSKLAETFKKLQECGTFSMFKKSIDSEEVEIRIDTCEDLENDSSAVTADVEDDRNIQNSMMFDYLYGSSSESEDDNDSEGGSDDSDGGDSEEDSERIATAPDPSELVLCCSEINSRCANGASASWNDEVFLAQRALHSVDLGKLMQARCYANCQRECIEQVGLNAIGKLRYFVWFERCGMKRSQKDRLEAIYELVKEAHHCYIAAAHGADDEMQRFTFMVGTTAVCELSFQQMIGIIPPKSKCVWKGWKGLKYRALGVAPPPVPKPKPPRNKKTRSCVSFIHNTSESMMGDNTSLARYGDYIYLPYRKIDHFFASYQHYCEKNEINEKERAGFKTFTNAFCAVKEEMKVKLQTDAGMHSCISCIIMS
jgi:hypothetical protein